MKISEMKVHIIEKCENGCCITAIIKEDTNIKPTDETWAELKQLLADNNLKLEDVTIGLNLADPQVPLKVIYFCKVIDGSKPVGEQEGIIVGRIPMPKKDIAPMKCSETVH